jgi:ribosomal protein S27E
MAIKVMTLSVRCPDCGEPAVYTSHDNCVECKSEDCTKPRISGGRWKFGYTLQDLRVYVR